MPRFFLLFLNVLALLLAFQAPAWSQAYRVAFLPENDQASEILTPDIFKLREVDSSKPVFNKAILQGLGDEAQLFSLDDPLAIARVFYIEGALNENAGSLEFNGPAGVADSQLISEFIPKLDALLAGDAPSEAGGLIILNAKQSNAGALSGLHILTSALKSTLNNVSLIVFLSADGPNAFDDSAVLTRRILQGYPDRSPFGNADGVLQQAEIENFLVRNTEVKDELLYSRIIGAKERDILKLTGVAKQEARDEIAYQKEEAEAQFSSIMEDADALEIYLKTCEFCPLYDEVKEINARLQRSAARLSAEENLIERVMQARSLNGLRAYLKTCQLCPRKAESESMLYALEIEERRNKENQAWETAKRFEDRLQITNYLKTCEYCVYRKEAGELRDTLLKREADKETWETARKLGSTQALETYINTCTECRYRAAAEIQLAELQAADQQTKELTEFRAAYETNDFRGLETYVNTCQFCENKGSAIARLADYKEAREAELANNLSRCQALQPVAAGYGSFIDLKQIRSPLASCLKVLEQESSNTEAATLVARIDIVKGDLAKARNRLAGLDFDLYPHAYTVQGWLDLRRNEGVTLENTASAIANFKSALAADRKDVFAGLGLARLILQGQVTDRTVNDAFALMQEAASQDNAFGQTVLGWMYENGQGTTADPVRAAEWYQKAVASKEPSAMGYLGSLYEAGQGVSQSFVKATDLFMDALDAGDSWTAEHLTTNWRARPNELLAEVQRRLQARGLYSGEIDGLFGPGTERSIRGLVAGARDNAFPLLGLKF